MDSFGWEKTLILFMLFVKDGQTIVEAKANKK